jgi:lipid-A-disaccharide synthase
LRLSRRAADCGVPVVYFVSPQVWAWRPGRVHSIGSLVKRMLVLFPFETEFYSRAGIPVSFVGHPLAEEQGPPIPRSEMLERLGLREGRPIVALLPGSRSVELARLLPLMLDAALLLKRRRPDLQFLLPLAAALPEPATRRMVDAAGVQDLVIHRGDFPWLLSVCDAGAVAAGTASLEAAVVGLPMVVVYRLNRLSYLVGRSLVRVDDVALPNLVAGRRIVPELIQSDCTPERIAAGVEAYLDDHERTTRVRAELMQLRDKLGGPGVFDRAADAVLAELDRVHTTNSSGA